MDGIGCIFFGLARDSRLCVERSVLRPRHGDILCPKCNSFAVALQFRPVNGRSYLFGLSDGRDCKFDAVEAIRTIFLARRRACAFPALQDKRATPTQAGKQTSRG